MSSESSISVRYHGTLNLNKVLGDAIAARSTGKHLLFDKNMWINPPVLDPPSLFSNALGTDKWNVGQSEAKFSIMIMTDEKKSWLMI